MITIITVLSINVCPAPVYIGERKGERIYSSIVKRPVEGPVEVGELGLIGDSQADKSCHGGLEKAVYIMANYSAWWNDWLEQRNANAAPEDRQNIVFGPGVLGENLTLSEWREADLHIGDEFVVRSPSGELRGMTFVVTRPRSPCSKQNLIVKGSSAALVENGLCGAYVAVRGSGFIHVGDVLELTLRRTGAETIANVYRQKMRKQGNVPHGM